MENMTVGEVRRDFQGTEFGADLNAAEAQVKRFTNGKSTDSFAILEFDEMGQAIGRFTPSTEKIDFRIDVFNDMQMFVHAGVHEWIHKGGTECGGEDHCLFEGFTELETIETIGNGEQPVDAYRGVVDGARKIVELVGDEAFALASQGVESRPLLIAACFSELLGKSANTDVEKAQQQAEKMVAAAERPAA